MLLSIFCFVRSAAIRSFIGIEINKHKVETVLDESECEQASRSEKQNTDLDVIQIESNVVYTSVVAAAYGCCYCHRRRPLSLFCAGCAVWRQTDRLQFSRRQHSSTYACVCVSMRLCECIYITFRSLRSNSFRSVWFVCIFFIRTSRFFSSFCRLCFCYCTLYVSFKWIGRV